MELTEKDNIWYNYNAEDEIVNNGSSPDQEKSLIGEILKQLKPGTEMYSVGLPAYLMRPVSLLEKMSTYAVPNFLLDGINLCNDPAERMLKVALWVFSSWRAVPSKTLEQSKPYNPVLGEVFECKWEHEDDKSITKYISEQVSHNPPISCFYSYNSKKKFSYHGFVEPTLGFHFNSVHSDIKGSINVELWSFDEKYSVTYPKVYCTGMFMGARNIEIWDKFEITCEKTGFKTSIDLKANDFTGKITKGKKVHYKLKGSLTGEVKYIIDKKEITAYDVKKIKREKILVTPIEKQKENESRRVWHKVTTAIRQKEYKEGTKEKNLVEQAQRDAKADREAKNIEWKPVHFEKSKHGWDKKRPPHKRINSIQMLKENYDLSTQQVDGLKSLFKQEIQKDSKEISDETKLSDEEFENLRLEVLKLLEQKTSSIELTKEEQKALDEEVMKKGSLLSESLSKIELEYKN
eukprot:gene9645-1849_t